MGNTLQNGNKPKNNKTCNLCSLEKQEIKKESLMNKKNNKYSNPVFTTKICTLKEQKILNMKKKTQQQNKNK